MDRTLTSPSLLPYHQSRARINLASKLIGNISNQKLIKINKMSLVTFIYIIISLVWLPKYSTAEIINVSGSVKSLSETKLTETLDFSGRIVLSWELGQDKSAITFELWAQTVGYVGFGISPNGGMAGADIFIAGVAPDGTPYSSDRFASGNKLPKIDSHQDWSLLEAKENETTTYLKFSRLVDTCDKDEDFPILKGTNRVIWAIGPTDELVKHSSMADRGTRSLSFLHKRPKFNESEFQTWIGGINGFEMPSKETTHWCSIHEGFPLNTPKYIVAYDAHLPDQNALNHIHHMVLYKCLLPEDGSFDETIESVSGANRLHGSLCSDLRDIPLLLQYCHEEAFIGFPKGNQLTTLPKNVAYKFDKAKNKHFFYLEAHIDNPGLSKGIVFDYGMKLFYTEEPRQYDASLFVVSSLQKGLLIPPNTQNFVYSGHCGSFCTQKLDPPGISIFSVQLHAHTFGSKLKFRHFRNDIELPWIAHEENFDFNYQQFRMLDEERKVLPGDRLVIECSFDSTGNNGKVVVGGLSSGNEMCQALALYYPATDKFLRCYSGPEEKEILAPWNITKSNIPTLNSTDFEFKSIEIEEPDYMKGNFEDYLNTKFNWSKDFIDHLQEWTRFEDQTLGCSNDGFGEIMGPVFSYPKNAIEYVPGDVCS